MIKLSQRRAFGLWFNYQMHNRLGNTVRAAIYKFILSNTYPDRSEPPILTNVIED